MGQGNLRIAQVNDIANVPATLMKGLRELGHQVELIPLELVGGKRSTGVKALLLPWRLREVASLNAKIREGRFNVVHIHYAYLGWAGILGRYKYFLHCHGTDVRSGLHDFVRRPITTRSLQQASRVFYSTPDLREHVTSVRPDAIWLPNPIDTERFRPVEPRDGRPRVLFISALSRIKGVDLAFQVIAMLQKRSPDLEISVMGFGDQLQSYARWPGISILPRVSYADMPALIQNYDIVVGQLRLGILSMSEMEAMACGKPIVGQYRYPEVYGEVPPVFAGETADELAGQVMSLADDATRRAAVGQESRAWVVKNHDYRTIARLLERYYHGVP